jgi:hypothetical protein
MLVFMRRFSVESLWKYTDDATVPAHVLSLVEPVDTGLGTL